jgi:spore coat protein U-like protein
LAYRPVAPQCRPWVLQFKGLRDVFQKYFFCNGSRVAVSASGLSLEARAAASTPIQVSANVTQACSISTKTQMVFGAYDPIGTNATAALNATGQVCVACSKGAKGLTIGMDNGIHAVGTQRNMAGTPTTNLLLYNIFQPNGESTGTTTAACSFPATVAWTNLGGGTFTVTNAPDKTVRIYNVCGTIPGSQDAAVDTYTDTVTATINF